MDIAFDLGTTFSLVAAREAGKSPRLVTDAKRRDERRTPSVVLVEGVRASIGWALERRMAQLPDLPAQRFIKAELASGRNLHCDTEGRDWTAEALSALILKKLMKDVASSSPDNIQRTRIAVPASFNDSQLRATLLSARLAGLVNVDTIPEPLAAAHYYNAVNSTSARRHLMVYDFGGGTFDVSIVETDGNSLRVLANDGHPALGGRLIDAEITRRVLESAGIGLESLTAGEREWLRQVSEKSKIALSERPTDVFQRDVSLGGRPFSFVLVWREFEDIINSMVFQSIAVCERCLTVAGLSWGNISAVLLTGGSCQFPQVRAALAKAGGITSADGIQLKDPHAAVAFGAVCSMLEGASADPVNTSLVSGYELLMSMRAPNSNEVTLRPLLARNSVLPLSAGSRVKLARDNQSRLVFQAWQRSSLDADPIALGHRVFSLPSGLKAGERMEFIATMEHNGLVSVRLKHCESGQLLEETHEFGDSVSAGNSNYEQQLKSLVESVLVFES